MCRQLQVSAGSTDTGKRSIRYVNHKPVSGLFDGLRIRTLLRLRTPSSIRKSDLLRQGVNDAYTEQLESILQLPLTYLEYVLLDQDLASIQNTLDNEQQIQLNALDAL